MADKWETSVGQLRLVDGSRQTTPMNVGATERRSFLPISGRGKGRLYVLIELGGEKFGREELCQDLVAAVTEEYFDTPGTVTYGLRQAVLLANTHLLRANARVSSEHRAGGIACVVLRGSELFIAQAGWPTVYLMRREHVQAFPDTTLEAQDTSMLGQRQTTEVRLFHANVQPRDMLLIVDGPMARQIGTTRVEQVLSDNVEHALRNLEVMAPPQDCTALVIQMGAATGQARSKEEPWAFTPVETPPTAEQRAPSEPAPASSPATETMRKDLAQERLPAPIPVQTQEEQYVPPPPRPHTEQRMGSMAGERAKATLKALGKGVRTLGERMLPDESAQRTSAQRRRTRGARRTRGKAVGQPNWGIAAAIAIPILALIFVGAYMVYRNWSLQSQYSTQLEAATLKRDIAVGSAESPTVARDYWIEVIKLAQEADALNPDQPEVLQLVSQAQSEIDRIDGVTRLGPIYKLYEYTAPGSAPSRILVAGLDVYVLDRGTGRVYHHALNELRNALRTPDDDQILIQERQPVEGQNVGMLVDIAWMRDGGERQAGALLILDRNGLLLEYDPSWEQFRTQILGGQDTWRSPTALQTFDSNLYLLDTMANQVLKYPDQQFASPPARWITQSDVDLTNALDMAIDGNIYVLYSTGTLSKFYGGESVPFDVTRISKPMTSAEALYLDIEEATQYGYVGDGSEMRIVQLDRNGTFIRQLRPAAEQETTFRQLTGIFADEVGGKLFYVATNTLYVTDLPPVQR